MGDIHTCNKINEVYTENITTESRWDWVNIILGNVNIVQNHQFHTP